MAQNYQTINLFPFIKNFSIGETWTEITFPPKGKVVTVGCEQHDMYVAFEGTEGGATSSTDKVFIKAGGYMQFKLGRGNNNRNQMQVATKSASTATVTVIVEEK